MRLSEMIYTEEEMQELREENRKLKNELMEDMKTETKLNERIRFLEQCLDNKEKVNKSMRKDNKSLREEISKLKDERDFFKEQAILWRNDYKNEYEENKKLKEKVKKLEERLDNKEKVNKQLRTDLLMYQNQYGVLTD